jgi:DNA replication protein DnaC
MTTSTSSTPTTPMGAMRRRRGMTEEAAEAAVDQACRALRLPTVRSRVGEMLVAAEKEQLTYRGFLAELLLAECDDRARRRSARRVKAAGFPREKWIGDFDFDANPNVNAATINGLANAGWVRSGHPLCLIGDSGTGKSHLLIALGTCAADAGYRVKYTLATKLVNELVEAADEKMLAKTIARYGRVDLLCIDELGYMELDAAAPSCCSRSSPNGRRRTPWPSPPTSRSPAGPKPSPTPACALRSSIGSPSADTSSRPAPSPTAWLPPSPNAPADAGVRARGLTVGPTADPV